MKVFKFTSSLFPALIYKNCTFNFVKLLIFFGHFIETPLILTGLTF